MKYFKFACIFLAILGFMLAMSYGIGKSIENQDTMLCESAKISGNTQYLHKCECYYQFWILLSAIALGVTILASSKRYYLPTRRKEVKKMIDPDMKEVADEIPEDNEESELMEENEEKGEFDVEIFLSTDGKHTVHVKSNSKNAKEAIASAMNAYDYVLARYGTKQAQAVKEYSNGEPKIDQETCKHTNVKFVQSKTEKNPGRWFKTCADCKKFLGWQS